MTGKSQSPINFVVEEALIDDTLEPFIFHGYDKMTTTPTAVVKNDGHTLKMELRSSPRLTFSKLFRPSIRAKMHQFLCPFFGQKW